MILTQSKVKAFESTTCKRLFQAEYETGEQERKPNEYMLRGLFFEQEALGASAHSQEPVQLPRLKSGEKSVAQIRLELQARRFQRMFNPESPDFMGWQITDKQLLLKDGEREGTIDFVCRRDGVVSVWDLKSCEDLTSVTGWGNIQNLDLIQQGWYRHLYMKNFGIDPELFLIIFDYGTQERCKVIKLNISEESQARYLQRFDNVEESIFDYTTLLEFPRVPTYRECNRCSLPCELRAMTPTVQFEEITI